VKKKINRLIVSPGVTKPVPDWTRYSAHPHAPAIKADLGINQPTSSPNANFQTRHASINQLQAQWQTGKLSKLEVLQLHELTNPLGGAYSLASPLSLPSASDHGFLHLKERTKREQIPHSTSLLGCELLLDKEWLCLEIAIMDIGWMQVRHGMLTIDNRVWRSSLILGAWACYLMWGESISFSILWILGSITNMWFSHHIPRSATSFDTTDKQ
jgi:hypothetical protein